MIFLNEFKKVVKDEDGAVAIIAALVLFFVLIGIAAFAIDIGNQTTAKNELQNAVDAAALAGAVKLAEYKLEHVDSDEIDEIKDEGIAAAYNNKVNNVTLNLAADDIKPGKWNELQNPMFEIKGPENAVRVTVNNHSIDSFFASIFNSPQSVSATATAVVGPLSGKRHLIPIAVTETEAKQMKADEEGTIYESGKSPGNWGTVDFDAYLDHNCEGIVDDQGGGANEIGDWLEPDKKTKMYGYNRTIHFDECINTESGLGKIGSNRQKVKNLYGKRLFIPVVDKFGGGSTPDKPSTVKGFIAIRIKSLTGSGKHTEISAEYLGKEVTSGPIDLGLEDSYGPISIALVE